MNTKLDEAEKRMQQEEQSQRLADWREEDLSEIERIAFSSGGVTFDLVNALSRVCGSAESSAN